MGLLFSHCAGGGRQKNNKISNTDKAVLDLKIQRDKLKQLQTQINLVILRETAIAKECAKSNKKPQALLALKKKKYQEKMLEDSLQNLSNVEELINNIEQSEIQVQIFESLKKGNNALKDIQKELSLEDVEKLMEETEEAIQYQNDISEALSGKFSQDEEDALLQELDDMEKQMLQLPDVPKDKIDVPIEHIIQAPVETQEAEREREREKQREREREPQMAV
ncbi:hypothetical protein CYY_005130 [Polysphondylium violaceum]|uniref:SNF7 family protein n=1 Tax=Polysphondylium violaceum TaxID=133409 RepID=A0A8J4UYS9_9MYCE|nr:hypothetical protein CYY_005130 [Polysphondylium violaceum]